MPDDTFFQPVPATGLFLWITDFHRFEAQISRIRVEYFVMEDGDFIFKELTYDIIGAAMDVYNNLGNGFLEAVYSEALCIELRARDIQFKKEKELEILYKEIILDKKYKADLIVADCILLELKAKTDLSIADESQVLNYMNCTGIRVGLLLNFGGKSLEWKRLIL